MGNRTCDDMGMFYSRFNRVLAAVVWLFCAGAVTAIVSSGIWNNAEYLPLVAFVAFLAWVGLWRPFVRVTETHVTLGNVLSTIEVPWPALIQVDTHYALTLVTPQRRYSATAAPAPGRIATAFGSRSVSSRDMSGMGSTVAIDGRVRPGDLPNTDSGTAAYLVRARWEQLIAQGRIELGIADETPVLRRWHWPTISIGVVLLAGTIVAFLLG